MAKLKNIRSLLSKGTDNPDTFEWPSVTSDANLKTAMAEANRSLHIAEEIKAIASDEAADRDLEKQMAVKLAEDLNVEIKSTSVSANTVKPRSDAVEPNLDSTEDLLAKTSKRILELQRRQASVAEIREHITNTNAIIEALSKKSDQLYEYFTKANLELTELEYTEQKYKNLYTASEALAREHRELRSKLEEKYDEVQQLEGVKQKNRDMLENAQLKINRLLEKVNEQASEIQSVETQLMKSKDDNVDLSEKQNMLLKENEAIAEKNRELQAKIDGMEDKFAEQEKLLSRNNLEMENMAADIEQRQLDLHDVQGRYNKLNEKYTEVKAQFDQAKFSLEAERSSSEEKIRLKDARIIKLERGAEILNNQLAMTEHLLGNAKHENALADLKKAKRKKASRVNAKKSAVAVSADEFAASVSA